MAGFWIPWELGLSKKREVMIISRSLGVSRREAAAMCMEVWEWAQDQTLDGLIAGMCPIDVSDAVGIPGIGESMELAGWLRNGGGTGTPPTGLSSPTKGRSSATKLRAVTPWGVSNGHASPLIRQRSSSPGSSGYGQRSQQAVGR
jgi:hypothetical protein